MFLRAGSLKRELRQERRGSDDDDWCLSLVVMIDTDDVDGLGTVNERERGKGCNGREKLNRWGFCCLDGG